MADRYDAVVIGAGPAGEVAAGALADGGMKVAIVEREKVGGECSYWACIPSKTLLRPPEVVHQGQEAPGAKEAITGETDASEAFAWRDYMVSDYDDEGQTKFLDDKGIELLRGEGKLDGSGCVKVDDNEIETDNVVIATGTDALIPPIDGLDEVDGLWTNREVTGMNDVPESIIVMGGGAVGVEMSQVLVRLGAKVTLIDGDGHALPREADAAGLAIEEALAADGVDVQCGKRAQAIATTDDGGYVVTVNDGEEFRSQKVLIATGRKPRVADLGLDSVDVEWDEKKGVKVDDHLRAGDGIWAVGDVTGVSLFTHVGKYQARIAAANILGNSTPADYRAVPRVVFTDPQVAAVGETDGSKTGTAELKGVARTSTYTRAWDEKPGFLTLVSDGDKLTGAFAVGPEAGEWIQQATLAIRAEVPLDVLRDTIQPFPTFSEAFVNALSDLD